MSFPAAREPEPAVILDIRRLRADAERAYSETDLVVAALRDNIRDLRIERDRLEAELTRLRDEVRRTNTPWLARGTKPNR
ncbi:MAG: hypothetical protein ACSLFM_11585 [Tepidiformaceae bacterium]